MIIPSHPVFGRPILSFVTPGSGSSAPNPVPSDPVPPVGTQSIFAYGADWKYYDSDADPGAFTTTGYDDSSWSSGPGELGFGDGDEATVITKSTTNASYAFRKTVDITSGSQYDEYNLNVKFDDGVVVYVNGVEQARSSNWAAGPIVWNQFATSTISDNATITPTIPASAFEDGENVIAVQVSNNTGSSSDVSFNMSLEAVKNAEPYDHVAGDYAVFTSASAVANVADGPTSLDEISGMTALSGYTSNIGTFAVIDDNVNDRIFFVDRDGVTQGSMVLESDTWIDGEAIAGYTDQTTGTRHLVIGSIGDNPGTRDTKKLILTEEPEVDGTTFTIAASSYEVVEYRYPSSPAFVDSPNNDDARGDAESMFVCPIDEKIYVISKREQINRVYSLPLQASYTGVQTMTYEGEMTSEVVANTSSDGVPSSPNPYANAVEAAISNDLTKVLVKTYTNVYQFYRTDTAIPWSTVLTVSSPVEETNYVGFGSGPSQEPQGEAMTFDANDNGYYTISEYTGAPGSLPIYFYPMSAAEAGVYSITQGKDGYTSGEDTWIWSRTAERGYNYSSAPTLISDINPSDERWSYTKFGDLDALFADNSTVVVESASFTFYVAVEGQGIAFYEGLTAVDASTVTYNTMEGTLSSGLAWADYAMAEDPLANNFVGEVTVNLPVSTVQNWIRNPGDNYGFWHLATHPSDGQQLSSFEAPIVDRRPTLNFTVTV